MKVRGGLLVLGGIALGAIGVFAVGAYIIEKENVCTSSDHDRAIAACTTLVEWRLSTTLENTFYNRGISYLKKGAHDSAIADFTRAIELNPKLVAAFSNRGAIYAAKGAHDSAIADYTKVIELNSMDVVAFYNRGVSYLKKRAHDSAIADFTRAIELNPKLVAAFSNRGFSYAAKGAHDSAIADFTRVIELNPTDAVGFYNRGVSYDDKGEYDNAIADYDHAIKIKPDHADAIKNRAISSAAKQKAQRVVDPQKELSANDRTIIARVMYRAISRCWNINTNIGGIQKIVVNIEVRLTQDGEVVGSPRVLNTQPGPAFLAAADSASRAIVQCAPYILPRDKYAGGWEKMVLTFDFAQILR